MTSMEMKPLGSASPSSDGPHTGATPIASRSDRATPSTLKRSSMTQSALDLTTLDLDDDMERKLHAETDALEGWSRIREQIRLTMEVPTYSTVAAVFNVIILGLILVSVVAFILETLPALKVPEYESTFYNIEFVVVVVFTAEYVTRLCVAHNRTRFVLNLMNMIDLLAILPFYIERAAGGGDQEFLRVVRVVRLARVFRLFKNSPLRVFMGVLTRTVELSRDAGGLVVSLICLLVIVAATVLYFAERDQVDQTNLRSIPEAMYWAVITVTTVGYGEIAPLGTVGQIVAMITMFLGLVVVSFPVIIVGGNFETVYHEFRMSKLQQAVQRASSEDLDADGNPSTLFLSSSPEYLQFVRDKREELSKAVRTLRQAMNVSTQTRAAPVDAQRFMDEFEVVYKLAHNIPEEGLSSKHSVTGRHAALSRVQGSSRATRSDLGSIAERAGSNGTFEVMKVEAQTPSLELAASSQRSSAGAQTIVETPSRRSTSSASGSHDAELSGLSSSSPVSAGVAEAGSPDAHSPSGVSEPTIAAPETRRMSSSPTAERGDPPQAGDRSESIGAVV